MTEFALAPFAILLFAYLAGSIPFCWLLAMGVAHEDLREFGDRNVGGGNLMALAGTEVGLAGLVLDVAKGALPVVLALALGQDRVFALLAGAVAVGGHIWPFWLGFRGGRGAAPALGVSLALYPLAMVLLLCLGIVVIVLTRNTVAAILTIMPVIPFIAWFAYAGALEVLLLIALYLGVGARDFTDRRQARNGHPAHASPARARTLSDRGEQPR